MMHMGQIIILSDGQRTAFVSKTKSGVIVYYTESCYIRDMSMIQEAQTIDVPSLDSYEIRYAHGPCRDLISVNFEVMGKIEIGGEELLKVFRTVDSLSIEGLFQIIQERIKERD